MRAAYSERDFGRRAAHHLVRDALCAGLELQGHDDEAPDAGSFWHALPPQGYTELGDLALGRDGKPGQVIRSHEVPKFVCIKSEYVEEKQREALCVRNRGLHRDAASCTRRTRNWELECVGDDTAAA